MIRQRLAIVGSTDLRDTQREVALWIVECILRSESPAAVVSGGAVGIDNVAANAARLAQIPVVEFLPETNQWEDQTYPVRLKGYRSRNIQIAQYCDALVSIRSTQSTTYGSGWTADYTERELGKTVRRLFV